MQCLHPLKSLFPSSHSRPAPPWANCVLNSIMDRFCLFLWYVFFCVWLLLLNVMSVRSIYVVECAGVFLLLLPSGTPMWGCASFPLLSPVSGHPGCFQIGPYNEQSCYKYPWTSLLVDVCFHSLNKYLRMGLLGCMLNVCLPIKANCQQFCKVILLYFHWQCTSSNFSISLPEFGVISLLNFSHHRGCEIECHCSFSLHFPDD